MGRQLRQFSEPQGKSSALRLSKALRWGAVAFLGALYGALLLLIDGLSNVAKGWATWLPRVAVLLREAWRVSL